MAGIPAYKGVGFPPWCLARCLAVSGGNPGGVFPEQLGLAIDKITKNHYKSRDISLLI
jgi:hypothetical protein